MIRPVCAEEHTHGFAGQGLHVGAVCGEPGPEALNVCHPVLVLLVSPGSEGGHLILPLTHDSVNPVIKAKY